MRADMSVPHCQIGRSRFGPFAVLWSVLGSQPRVFRVLLSRPGVTVVQQVNQMFPNARVGTSEEINQLTDQMKAFLRGADITFPLDIVRMDLCSAFQQEVLRVEHAIPRGCVSTYRLIAAFIGSPSSARAVGTALATNPFPIVIPCHRAIRSDMTLGGYQGGLHMKRSLLESEGVRFDNRGRVVTDTLFFSDAKKHIAHNNRPQETQTIRPTEP